MEARSTKGDDIRNENVTPIGKPLLVNPINNGIEEQEQNGVIVPKRAAKIFAHMPLNLPRIFLVLSGGKKLWIYEIENIRADNSINIFITSYIKKCILPPIFSLMLNPKVFSTSFFTKFDNQVIFSKFSFNQLNIFIHLPLHQFYQYHNKQEYKIFLSTF